MLILMVSHSHGLGKHGLALACSHAAPDSNRKRHSYNHLTLNGDDDQNRCLLLGHLQPCHAPYLLQVHATLRLAER
jgi:hypothetical protein